MTSGKLPAITAVTVFFALASAASHSATLSIKTGLDNIRGNYTYLQTHMPNVATIDSVARKDEVIRVGAASIGGELDEQLGENCYVGLLVSAGVPFQAFSFDSAKLVDPDAGVVNINDGDKDQASISQIKMMVAGGYRKAMGAGEASLSLGAGIIRYNMTRKTVDQWWTDGVIPSNSRMLASDTGFVRVTTYSTGSVTVPAVEVTPGYYWKVGEKYRLGLEVPLSLSARGKMSGVTTEPSEMAPTVGPMGYIPVVNMGGFNWAAYLVFAKASI